jgi:hypothetical protein
MSKLFSKLLSPAVLLYVYLIITTVAQGIYSASGIEAPAGFTLLLPVGYLWIIGWWLRADSRKQGVAWVYDMGLFLNIAWPFFMPYYLLKTRGAKGLLVMLVFAGVFIGAFALGTALYFALATLNS